MDANLKIHQLVVRLFSGEATEPERKQVESWLNSDPENEKLFRDLREIWLSAGVDHNPDGYDVEKAIQLFRQKTSIQSARLAKRNRVSRFIQYAAIFLLGIIVPTSYFFGRKQDVIPENYTTINCALGDKTSVILPDSSKVVLNSGSQLTFNNNFKKGVREVSLNGEAYFSVEKDPANPFKIKTPSIEVEVLGTEFNLKAYKEDQEATTTLVSGSLKVKRNQKSVVIKPNQKLTYDKASDKMHILELNDLSSETGWKEGRLVFRNESLGQLEKKLERWFDVEIEFSDELVKNRSFTGTLERESILEVIAYFGRSKYVNYHIVDNAIIFYTEK